MDRNEERESLKPRLTEYVERVTKKGKGGFYVCPLCGSGTGKNGTAAFRIDETGEKWKCFSCEAGGDIFDLIGKVENISEYVKQVDHAREIFGGSIYTQQIHTTYTHKSGADTEGKEVSYKEYFEQCFENISKTDYAKKRGLTEKTINRFFIGYDEHWKNPKNPNVKESERLIIPTSEYSYTARAIHDDEYRIAKAGKMHIFNEKALWEAEKPVFVVEGEIDAMSIIEAGGEAVGLGGVSGTNLLANILKEKKPTQPLLIALDNDEAGKKASDRLIAKLQEIDVVCTAVDIYGTCKDANAALVKDRIVLTNAVKAAEETQSRIKEAEKEEYLNTAASKCIGDFLKGISDSANTDATPTGFSLLDSVLDGGLYEGLYVLGAISSLGKTTFVMQVADQIAQSGTDVIIISLEMSKYELISKSISRHTMLNVKDSGEIRLAKTARGITSGKRWERYSEADKKNIAASVGAYSKYADHIFIHEGIGNIGVEYVRETVQKHISFTGNKPVVIVDYIQILAPYNERMTDKQNTDKAVLELKRISRDYKIPVIGISSFNRQNYKSEVAMEAFKESGAIEYSSDVLIGLQLEGAGSPKFNATEAKAENPRKVQLVILKNRGGAVGRRLSYAYYAMFNYFEEIPDKLDWNTEIKD